MTITALPQLPTVNCRSTTPDAGSGARQSGVSSLADLVSHATDVTFGHPGDLGPCEDCMGTHSIAVAVVSWPDPAESDGRDEVRDEIAVCRDCVARQLAIRAASLHLDARIAVEAPSWSLADLAEALGCPGWENECWDLLAAEDVRFGAVTERRYLADEVAHGARLLTLSRWMTLAAADRLLRRRPDLVDAVEHELEEAA